MNASKSKYSTLRWILLSQLLLAIYLGFFHFVTNRSPSEIFIAGLVGSAVAIAVVFVCRNLFLSRLQHLAHYVVGVDIFLEGFVPKHEGYGFYYCAAGFWIVFFCHHAYLLYIRKPAGIKTELLSQPQVESL